MPPTIQQIAEVALVVSDFEFAVDDQQTIIIPLNGTTPTSFDYTKDLPRG